VDSLDEMTQIFLEIYNSSLKYQAAMPAMELLKKLIA
jgi:hypothetical protein